MNDFSVMLQPNNVIFVIADDSTLWVLADLDAVRRECEPWDVESGLYEFFDSAGQRLIPSFAEPVKKGSHLFGLVTSVWGGQYELVRFEGEDAHDFDTSIANVAGMEPNPWFADIKEVHKFVIANRATRSTRRL